MYDHNRRTGCVVLRVPVGFTMVPAPSFFGGTAGAGSLSNAADGAGGIAGVVEAADTACMLLVGLPAVAGACEIFSTGFSTGTAGCALSLFSGLTALSVAGEVVVHVDVTAGAAFTGGGGGGGSVVAAEDFPDCCCAGGDCVWVLFFFPRRNMPLSIPLSFSTLRCDQPTFPTHWGFRIAYASGAVTGVSEVSRTVVGLD